MQEILAETIPQKTYDRLKHYTDNLIQNLESGQVVFLNIEQNMSNYLSFIVEPVANLLNEMPRRKNYQKEASKVFRKFMNLVTDTIEGILEMEIGKQDYAEHAADIRKARKSFDYYFTNLNKMEEFEELASQQLSLLFSMAEEQTQLDAKFFTGMKKRSAAKTKKSKKLIANVLVHCEPGISDASATEVGLDFRIVEGYCMLRNQKILAVDSSKVDDVWEYAKRKDFNGLVPMQFVQHAHGTGVSYVWFMPVQQHEVLFSNVDVNAWCHVKP